MLVTASSGINLHNIAKDHGKHADKRKKFNMTGKPFVHMFLCSHLFFNQLPKIHCAVNKYKFLDRKSSKKLPVPVSSPYCNSNSYEQIVMEHSFWECTLQQLLFFL